MKRWTRIKYHPNLPLKEGKYVTCSEEHKMLAREAAKEGIVLLKNENHILPIKKGTRLAMFGRGSADYVKGGGGSGAVLVKKETTLYDALNEYPEHLSLYKPLYDFYYKEIQEQYAMGLVPGMTYEPELPKELLTGAKEFADTAMIVISRFSGEGWDRSDVEYFDGVGPDGDEKTMPRLAGKYYPDGDFYITAEENQMIAKVKENFENVIVGGGEKVDHTMYLIDVRGKVYCGVHGDFDGSAGKVQALQTMAQKPLYAVLSGHLHHNKIDDVQGIKTIMAGSFLGMDDYCVQKRIYGRAEQMVCVCDSDGVRCSYPVPLN